MRHPAPNDSTATTTVPMASVPTSPKAPGVTDHDPLALEEQVCFALVVAARTVVGVYKPLLDPLGLTHPQYLVMLALWGSAPLSVKDLSGMLELDPGTLSPLLKRLETAGLLTRTRRSDDERHLSVSLTAKGLALRTRALQIPPAVVAGLGLPIEELRALHGALTAVIAAATGVEHTAAPEHTAGIRHTVDTQLPPDSPTTVGPVADSETASAATHAPDAGHGSDGRP